MNTDHKEHRRVEKEFGKWNPCLSCGACCIAFRASFYWAEGDDAVEGSVPVYLTEKVNAFRRAMRKTSSHDQRCIALHGTPSNRVKCTIYERRPTVCRDFEPSWKAEVHNSRCDKARSVFGLKPLSPDLWIYMQLTTSNL
ncbi:MAG: YkgJ family cysteine cluster protein [Smithella sp.]